MNFVLFFCLKSKLAKKKQAPLAWRGTPSFCGVELGRCFQLKNALYEVQKPDCLHEVLMDIKYKMSLINLFDISDYLNQVSMDNSHFAIKMKKPILKISERVSKCRM